jgi:zinc protease
VLRPRFEEAEWAGLKAEVGQGLMYRKMDPGSLAYYTLEELVFPIGDGRPALEASVASVAGLTIDDVRAAHARLFQPKAMTLHSVGSMSLDAVKAELDRAFGGWKSDGPGVAAVGYPPAVFADGLKVVVTPSMGNSQAIIELARSAPAFDEPGMMEAIAVARLLGSDSNSRLNNVLRETKGYSYGVSASVYSNLRTHGLMTVTAPVQADKVGEALTDIIAGFKGLTTVPVTDEELQRTAMASATGTAGTVETSGSLFGQVMAAASMGLTVAELHERLGEIVALKLPNVQEVADALAPLDRAVVVIAGDPQVIVPQLEAIGITDVTVLPPEE